MCVGLMIKVDDNNFMKKIYINLLKNRLSKTLNLLKDFFASRLWRI